MPFPKKKTKEELGQEIAATNPPQSIALPQPNPAPPTLANQEEMLKLQKMQGALALPPNVGLNVATGQQVPVIEQKNSLIARSQAIANNPSTIEQRAAIGQQIQDILFNRELSKFPELENITGTQTPAKVNETYPEGSIPDRIGKLFGKGEQITGTQTLKNIGGGIARTTADIWDVVHSSVSGKPQKQVTKAISQFTDATAIIDKEIALVKVGAKSYPEVRKSFEDAIASITSLETAVKGKGKLNLNYWIDEGKELEVQIVREKQILENQRIELLAAAQQARAAGFI